MTASPDLATLMPENVRRNFSALKMEPGDWAELDKLFTRPQYVACVLAYQAKERERYPRCNSLFGLCPYYERGLCTSKNPCAKAEKA